MLYCEKVLSVQSLKKINENNINKLHGIGYSGKKPAMQKNKIKSIETYRQAYTYKAYYSVIKVSKF